jgi:hypothetical protein
MKKLMHSSKCDSGLYYVQAPYKKAFAALCGIPVVFSL